jgi:gas vesicle protein
MKSGLGFLLGFTAGVVVAIIWAPKSGAETRSWIVRKKDELKRRSEQKAEQIAEQAKQKAGDVGSKVGREAAVDAAKDNLLGKTGTH